MPWPLTYFLFNPDMVLLYRDRSLAKVRAWAFQYRSQSNVMLTIEDQYGKEYTLGRYSTGNLFQQPEVAEKDGVCMGWDDVKKAVAGPFVKFEKDQWTKVFVLGEPEVIKAKEFEGDEIEDVGVMPVIFDDKFKVVPLRSTRLRNKLIEAWEIYDGKSIEILKTGSGTETQYDVRVAKSKKKPDARLIASGEKAFAAFIRDNKKRYTEVPSD